MKGSRLLALVLGAATLVAAGCGGSKSAATTASTPSTASQTASQAATQTAATSTASTIAAGQPLTSAQLIDQADAICYGVNAKRAAITITSNAALAQALPRVAAYDREELSELSKLVPPASMAKDWKAIILRTQTVANDTAKLVAFLNTNPHLLEGRPTLLKIKQAEAELATIAKRDNFKDCAQNS